MSVVSKTRYDTSILVNYLTKVKSLNFKLIYSLFFRVQVVKATVFDAPAFAIRWWTAVFRASEFSTSADLSLAFSSSLYFYLMNQCCFDLSAWRCCSSPWVLRILYFFFSYCSRAALFISPHNVLLSRVRAANLILLPAVDVRLFSAMSKPTPVVLAA